MKKFLSLFLLAALIYSCSRSPEKDTHNSGFKASATFETGKGPSYDILLNKDSIFYRDTTIFLIATYKLQELHKYVQPAIPPVTTPVDPVPPVDPGTRANLILENTFEGNPFTGFTLTDGQYVPTAPNVAKPKNINQVTCPDGQGKCLQYILNSSDTIISSSKRAEIQLDGTDAPETSERWYGLRYWLEKYDRDNGAESILQWHDKDGTTPPLSLQVSQGSLDIVQSFNSGNTHNSLGAYTTGKWITIVIHVKWTSGNTGLLEVWRDGKQVISKANIRTNSKGGSYMKIGINKWSWAPGGGSSTATQRIFYIDDFRMGNEKATYNDVAP